MADFRRQAERFGAEFVTDDVTRVDFSERPFRVYVGDDEHRADCRDRRDRRERTPARPPVGADAAGPRRLVLRDLRRRVLPRQGRRRRRRRRLGDGGGDLPHPLREQGRDRPPARRVPGVADHGRPRAGEREDRVRPERRRRRGARRGRRPRHGRPAARHRDRRDAARSRPTASSSRSATIRRRRSSWTGSTTTTRATS